jgi:hypothetical protein
MAAGARKGFHFTNGFHGRSCHPLNFKEYQAKIAKYMPNKNKKPAASKPKPSAKPAAAKSAPTKPAAGAPAAAPAPRAGHMPQTLRGFRDILPSEQKYWRHVYRKAEEITASYGYERLDTPILEETSLFVRSVGKQTDVVEKEMFSFLDKGNDNVTLRPEGTAALARAYVLRPHVPLRAPASRSFPPAPPVRCGSVW